MGCGRTHWLLGLLVLLACAISSSGESDDAKNLIKFRQSLSNYSVLKDWNENVTLCTGNRPNWKGLVCLDGNFVGLQLEGMGLSGTIDINSLAGLSSLKTMSFMNNNFEGPMPNINKIGGLRGFYISNNRFSGEIPGDAFSATRSMRRVFLGNNNFSGKIPESLVRLPRLVEVHLEDNHFEGALPNFEQKDLVVNVANNKLEGPIPPGLSNENLSLFEGNPNLCDKPLKPCESPKKHSFPKIALIVILSTLLAIAVIITACFIYRKKQSSQYKNVGPTKPHDQMAAYKTVQKDAQHADDTATNYKKSEQHGKLYFVRDTTEKFDLSDLLRASAEVLGSGSFGSSYKAVLMSGATMVVKRFREMSYVGKEEFYEHMRRLGRLSHPNLLPLVAFYYKKDEKLLISDFALNGSLASHLHGNRSPKHPGLNWPTRLKIIKGVAKGLAYLYKELPLTLAHGHLKSSNVLLDVNFEPLLAEYALVPVLNKEHAQQLMVAYKSPESTQTNHVTKKTDVWCLGILILEVLTGKFPANYLTQGKGDNADLASWVNSVVREEWTGEVFDKDLKGTKIGEGEMLKLLKIGMCCCEWNAEKRWDLWEAVEKIGELKERESDEEYSSYTSDGDLYSSRAMTEDEFSFSVAN